MSEETEQIHDDDSMVDGALPMRPAPRRDIGLPARVARVFLIAVLVVTTLLGLMGTSGYILFTAARSDPLQRADAVIVLAGEHDGREDYGIALARDGWAPNVVLSNPYPDDDSVMARACTPSTPRINVICARPSSFTTRGEAEMMQKLAAEKSWTTIIVVTWNYHLPRARLVFRQCFSSATNVAVMRGVPRSYDFSLAHWELVYAYQFGALAKAYAQGDCD
ncbi:YdcF family protein [Mycobacterium sp. URHB0044]|uniref:YdcF family protein n=1 Tax=Mycobacterium sp. URHB0044 TaxID=1380386 RepID=UPI000A6006AE|nr:YdcF family protein [Mycobacterium sp. URHB0044]